MRLKYSVVYETSNHVLLLNLLFRHCIFYIYRIKMKFVILLYISIFEVLSFYVARNVVTVWLALMLRIWEVPCSNLGPETIYPD
jgi:hypothetical protein